MVLWPSTLSRAVGLLNSLTKPRNNDFQSPEYPLRQIMPIVISHIYSDCTKRKLLNVIIFKLRLKIP